LPCGIPLAIEENLGVPGVQPSAQYFDAPILAAQCEFGSNAAHVESSVHATVQRPFAGHRSVVPSSWRQRRPLAQSAFAAHAAPIVPIPTAGASCVVPVASAALASAPPPDELELELHAA
jgi:hypothetical protein